MRTLAEILLTFVFNASWQILLIAATAALCQWLLRGTAARYQHAIWVVALILSIVLPTLSTAPRFLGNRVSAEQQRPEIASPAVYTRISSIEGEEIESAESRTPTAPLIVAPTVGTFASAIRLNPKVAATAFVLYLLILLYACVRFFRAWRRTRSIVSTAFDCELPESIQQIIQVCSRAIGTRRVRIVFSTSVTVPITVGVRKPLIILPQPLLHEVDKDVLTSAIAHEMVHVARYDYLMNLIYEFMYLPLWFHPAVSLIRARIRQTRELCCDERVASKLMGPEVYARSLVRLIGASPLTARLAADNTIGITDSDNLEVRIMSLLKTRKLGRRPQAVLLLLACLSLAVPCLAATSFAFSFEINPQEPVVSGKASQEAELQKHNQIRAELKQQIQELEQERLASPSQRPEIEARLREAKSVLEQHEKLAQQFEPQNSEARRKAETRLREVQENLAEHARLVQQYYQQRGSNAENAREAEKRLAELLTQYQQSAQMRDAQKVLENQQLLEKYRETPAVNQQNRKARVIHRVEPKYPDDARDKKITGSVFLTLTVDHDGKPQSIKIQKPLFPSMDQAAIEAAGQMRFEPAMKDGQPASQVLLVEFYFALDSTKHVEVMGYKNAGSASGQGTGEGVGYEGGVREMRRRKDQEGAGQDDRARRQVELAQGAVISMDRAIQIATSKFSGKVLACSLGRDKDGPVFYHLVIINTEGGQTTTKYVWISAIDGTIIKTEDEKKAAISGGSLNGKAVSLPNPEYPEIARSAQASGSVTVHVTIDEQGSVTEARALSGHPLLQGAAVSAARRAKFSPTYLQGQPVTVTGQLVYNFVIK